VYSRGNQFLNCPIPFPPLPTRGQRAALLYPSLAGADTMHRCYCTSTSIPTPGWAVVTRGFSLCSAPGSEPTGCSATCREQQRQRGGFGALRPLLLLSHLRVHVHSVNPRPHSYATMEQKKHTSIVFSFLAFVGHL